MVAGAVRCGACRRTRADFAAQPPSGKATMQLQPREGSCEGLGFTSAWQSHSLLSPPAVGRMTRRTSEAARPAPPSQKARPSP
jgi:hypothetical protein